MRQRHGLRVLAEAIAGENRVGVLAGETDQHPPDLVDPFEEPQRPLALERVDAHGGQVARAPSQVQAAANLLTEGADQILLAGVHASARLAAHLLHAVLLHLAEGGQDGLPVLAPEQPLFDQHDRLRLVERVERVKHGARAPRGQTA